MEAALVFLGLLLTGSFLFVFIAVIVLMVKSHAQSKQLANANLLLHHLQQQVNWLQTQAPAPQPDEAGAAPEAPDYSPEASFAPAYDAPPASSYPPQDHNVFTDPYKQPAQPHEQQPQEPIQPSSPASYIVDHNIFADLGRMQAQAPEGAPEELAAWTGSAEAKADFQDTLRVPASENMGFEEPHSDGSQTPLQDSYAEQQGYEQAGFGEDAFAQAFAADSQGVHGAAGAESASLWRSLSSFVSGGHAWVAGGVLLLFIAFALLLTYMASRGLFTMEMRIATAALSGLILLVLGWILREKRPTYSLVLQGGGIGLLYLAVFGATKLTPILSQEVGLLMITLLIPPTIILALRQQSQPLAIFGLLGGFAAPILLSTDSGNFVALFSYYTLLNIAVLIIGRFRLWRGLNLVAFLSTFGVALIWVLSRYEPEMFARAEPFMVGFVAIFTLLGILSAKNREIGLKNFIDLPITLGTPFVGAIIQWRMFSYIEHGLPIICIAFSAFYLLLTFIIWKREGVSLRSLAEGYLGLSVLLANLAIPLELSAKATSAVWAAEGILIYYFGVRTGSRRAMWTGLIFHAAAAIAFFFRETFPHYSDEYIETALFRYPTFTGCMIIALSALVVAVLARKRSLTSGEATIREAEDTEAKTPWLTRIMVVWGLCWWFGGWWMEFNRYYGMAFPYFFMIASFTALAGAGLARWLRFSPFRWAALAPVLFGFLYVAGLLIGRTYDVFSYTPLHVLTYDFFSGPGLWAWLLFFVTQGLLLGLSGKCLNSEKCALCSRAHAAWLFATLLISAVVLTCTGRAYTVSWGLSESWTSLAGILPALAFVVVLSLTGSKKAIASKAHRMAMLFWLPLVLVFSTSVWFLGTLFASGDPAPLPQYIPILNPLELEQAFCIAVIAFWQVCMRKVEDVPSLSRKALLTIIDVAVFFWLTAMLARATHFFMDIPMSAVSGSGQFQLALLILWGLYGIGHMLAGHKLPLRRAWVAGAILMLLDIGKLLLVDLAHTGTITRIISFFVAGLLLLFIGWVAPLPPASAKQQKVPYES